MDRELVVGRNAGYTPPQEQEPEREPNNEMAARDEPIVVQFNRGTSRSPTRERQVLQTQSPTPSTTDLTYCWICYDSDSNAPLYKHCKCTLVAHPPCLLQWIASQPPGKQGPKCPVCSTPYKIYESHSLILYLLKFLRVRWEKLSLGVVGTGIGIGVWGSLITYSVWSIRMWGGEKLAKILFERKWPLAYYVNLPLIPVALILSRTTMFDSLLPFVPLTILMSAPPLNAPLGSSLNFPSFSSLALTYPPSPALTVCVVPWIRILYLRARRALFDWALETNAHKNEESPIQIEHTHDAFEIDIGVVFEEENEGGQENGQIREGDDGQVEGRAEVEGENGGEAAGMVEVQDTSIRLSVSALAAELTETLMMPVFASCIGALLRYIALRFPGKMGILLRRMLCLRTSHKYDFFGINRPESMEPVWLHSTIGGGIFVALSDLIRLSVKMLEKKKIQSRTVEGILVDRAIQN